jgi:hypothetical protein
MDTSVHTEEHYERPDAADMRQQIDRIAVSPRFRNSDPLRFVLLYLAQQVIDHPTQTVKEYQIATSALGRPADFDPKADSSVRVVVTRLRGRLAEYYTHEGVNDPILVDIPKGGYTLSFTTRATLSTHVNATVSPAGNAAGIAPPRPGIWIAAAIPVVALAAFFLGRASIRPPKPPELTIFWDGFLKNGNPLIVFSNPVFQGTPEAGMRVLDPTSFVAEGTNDTFTGTGEVMAVHALTEELSSLGHGVSVKRSRLFTWDEAVAKNLIVVGGPAQSQVFLQLPQLKNLVLKPLGQPPIPGQEAVRNLRVDPARADAIYLPVRHRDTAVEYAIVALIEGASSDRSTLVLAGTNTFATEAAAKFVCDAKLLQTLFARLRVDPGRPVPRFEALLKVEIRGGAPIEPQLLLVYKRG